MGAKLSNHQDTYRAISVFLILTGLLYLADRWFGFSSHGLSWIMQKDTMILYAAITFLWFKSDKSIGIVLTGIWLIQNISLITALLGQVSGYLLPAALLAIGIILYFISTR